MTRLFLAEFQKIRKRRMVPAMAAIAAGIMAIIYLALALTLASDTSDDPTSLERATAFGYAVPFGFRIVVSQVVTVMAIILAASVIGGEYSWRTIVTLTAWTGDRARLMAARIAAIGAITLLGVLAGFAFAFTGSVVLAATRGDLDFASLGPTFPLDVLLGAGATWLGMMAYVSLATAIAVLTRSTAAAIAVALSVRFLEPLGTLIAEEMGGPLGLLERLSLSRAVGAVQGQAGAIDGLDQNQSLPDALTATLVVLLFTALMAALSLRTTIRRDVRE